MLLVGCSKPKVSEPKCDASTGVAAEASLQALGTHLAGEQKQEFNDAVAGLVLLSKSRGAIKSNKELYTCMNGLTASEIVAKAKSEAVEISSLISQAQAEREKTSARWRFDLQYELAQVQVNYHDRKASLDRKIAAAPLILKTEQEQHNINLAAAANQQERDELQAIFQARQSQAQNMLENETAELETLYRNFQNARREFSDQIRTSFN